MSRVLLAFPLGVIVIVAIAFALGQLLAPRANFYEAKKRTRENISTGSLDQQGMALLTALDQINFDNRQTPILAYTGWWVQADGRAWLFADWVVAENRIDGAEIRLKSGELIECPMSDSSVVRKDDYLYFHDYIILENPEVFDFPEIDSIALTSEGVAVTNWVSPARWTPPALAK